MTLQLEMPARNAFTTLGEGFGNAVLDLLRLGHIRYGMRNASEDILALDDRSLADIGLRPSYRADVSIREAVCETFDHVVSIGGGPYR